MSGKLYYWVADWNLSRAEADRLLGGHSVDMVDCTHASIEHVKDTTINRIAGYVTGSPDIRWTPGDWSPVTWHRQPGRYAFLKINQSNLDLPLVADVHYAIDVEAGAAIFATAALVARQRLAAGDDDFIYVDRANLAAMEEHIAMAGLAPGKIIAYQWASPTSNPNTRLPGTGKTLKEANADLSVILPEYLSLPGDPSPAHGHSLARARVQGDGTVQLDLRDMHWTPLDASVKVWPVGWGDE